MINRVIDAFEWLAMHFQFLFNWLFTPTQLSIFGNTYDLGAPIYLLIGGSIVILIALFGWKLLLG